MRVESFLVYRIFVTAGNGRYGSVEDCRVSNAEYFVHLVHTNRLNACREFCGVYKLAKWHKI